jgi:hypothetical protein
MRLRCATFQNSFTGHLSISKPERSPLFDVPQRVNETYAQHRTDQRMGTGARHSEVPRSEIPPSNPSLTTASLLLKIGLRIGI